MAPVEKAGAFFVMDIQPKTLIRSVDADHIYPYVFQEERSGSTVEEALIDPSSMGATIIYCRLLSVADYAEWRRYPPWSPHGDVFLLTRAIVGWDNVAIESRIMSGVGDYLRARAVQNTLLSVLMDSHINELLVFLKELHLSAEQLAYKMGALYRFNFWIHYNEENQTLIRDNGYFDCERCKNSPQCVSLKCVLHEHPPSDVFAKSPGAINYVVLRKKAMKEWKKRWRQYQKANPKCTPDEVKAFQEEQSLILFGSRTARSLIKGYIPSLTKTSLEDTSNKSVWDKDGFEHLICPKTQYLDDGLGALMSSVLYCIKAESLPNNTGAIKQSCAWQFASQAVLAQEATVKNELEQAAIAEAKQKGK